MGSTLHLGQLITTTTKNARMGNSIDVADQRVARESRHPSSPDFQAVVACYRSVSAEGDTPRTTVLFSMILDHCQPPAWNVKWRTIYIHIYCEFEIVYEYMYHLLTLMRLLIL